MRKQLQALAVFSLFFLFFFASLADAQPRRGGKSRVDFDAMDIRGQTKKADAVYLFDRGKQEAKQLVTPRKDYRKEILESEF